MPKEKNYNPVQAQHKAEKAKAIKKGKADVAAKRNERIAKRNPEQIRKQIYDLKAVTEGGGKLSRHQEQVLDGLEKELKAVNKAREALGDAAPQFRHYDPARNGVLGKRRRDFANENHSSSESDVPKDIQAIPMPRDTPPPIPKEILDKWWAKRRANRSAHVSSSSNANAEPLGRDRGIARHCDESSLAVSAAAAAPVEAKFVYESKPIVRDLKKEAAFFVPAAVRAKVGKSLGKHGLMEPEEADRLEQEGYLNTANRAAPALIARAAAPPVTLEEFEDAEG